MNSITIHAQNEYDLSIFKALAKRLNATVEENVERYDPVFLAKIKRSAQSKSIEIPPEMQREMLGL